MKRLVLPQYSWYEDKEIPIEFPDDWIVEFHSVPGDRWPALKAEDIAMRIRSPIGAPRLSEMACGKQRVVILFDDISRPTPTYDLVPPLLEELHAAGIKDDQIQFIAALGAHGAHSRIEFAKKLGEDIVRRYPVYNHNCYENNVIVGKTSKGTEVAVNSEYWRCDLRIGIGSVIPHPYTGFSGTGKIVVPGISSIDTTANTHFEASVGAREKGLNPVTGLGKWEESDMRKEVEEIALMAGPDFVLQALVGTRRQLIGLTSGHPVAAYHAAVEQALKAYVTQKASNMDVVVANASAKACEGVIALLIGVQSVKESGGDVVVISHSPTGQITHYLLSPFGRMSAAGRFCSRGTSLPANVGRVIVYSPYPSYADAEWFAPTDKVVWATTWQEVLDLLGDHGPGTKAAVYEDATMMYLSE